LAHREFRPVAPIPVENARISQGKTLQKIVKKCFAPDGPSSYKYHQVAEGFFFRARFKIKKTKSQKENR